MTRAAAPTVLYFTKSLWFATGVLSRQKNNGCRGVPFNVFVVIRKKLLGKQVTYFTVKKNGYNL